MLSEKVTCTLVARTKNIHLIRDAFQRIISLLDGEKGIKPEQRMPPSYRLNQRPWRNFKSGNVSEGSLASLSHLTLTDLNAT